MQSLMFGWAVRELGGTHSESRSQNTQGKRDEVGHSDCVEYEEIYDLR